MPKLNLNLIDLESYRENYEPLFENKELYFEIVRALTEKNYNIYKSVINPKNLKRGWRNNHVDHIYSISEGFKNRIDPYLISHPCNLQMLKAKENKKKNSKCGHTIEELYWKAELFGS
jgi:hypothetical protein